MPLVPTAVIQMPFLHVSIEVLVGTLLKLICRLYRPIKNEKTSGGTMPDETVKTVNESIAMRAALMHIMLLDDYIGAVLSRAEACGPGFLRESLIDYVETLQRERLSYYRIGLEHPVPDEREDQTAPLVEAA
jgi:hypothetical protein